MIIDMDFQPGAIQNLGEFADAVRLPGVDQNQPFDSFQGDLFHLDEIIKVDGGLEEKVAQVLLLGSGEDQEGLGIQFFGGQHGGQTVKVGVQVGGNHLKASGFGYFGQTRGLNIHGSFTLEDGIDDRLRAGVRKLPRCRSEWWRYPHDPAGFEWTANPPPPPGDGWQRNAAGYGGKSGD